MVKRGQCEVICLTCGTGIRICTDTRRNRRWEYDVECKSCPHFTLQVDVFTSQSVYSGEELKFNCYATCKQCSFVSYLKDSQKGTDCGSNRTYSSCHGNTAFFATSFDQQNSVEEIIQEIRQDDICYTAIGSNAPTKTVTTTTYLHPLHPPPTVTSTCTTYSRQIKPRYLY